MVMGDDEQIGMASGLETLCGQAYGAEQYQKLGIHTYSAILCLLVVSIPVSLLWVSTGRLLPLVGQDPEISRTAGRYAVWMIPGLFANAVSQPLVKFLQAQSLTLPMMFNSLATICLHVPLCWVLVFKSGLGYVGAALAVSISFWANVLVLGLYVVYSPSCKATRAPLTREAFRFRGIDEFLRIALSSALMICLEWWSFELLVLASGLLPNPRLETSVLSVCLTSITALYNIPYGISAAASTRVSNQLGAGNPQGARRSVRVALLMAATETLIVCGTLFAIRNVWGYAYSDEEEVISYATKMAPLICISVTLDGLQGVLSGIARGCGWQHLGAYVNLGAFYLFGLPAAAVLGFYFDLRGRGLWIGIIGGAAVQTTLLSLITCFTNWQQQANLARERLFGERLPRDDGFK